MQRYNAVVTVFTTISFYLEVKHLKNERPWWELWWSWIKIVCTLSLLSWTGSRIDFELQEADAIRQSAQVDRVQKIETAETVTASRNKLFVMLVNVCSTFDVVSQLFLSTGLPFTFHIKSLWIPFFFVLLQAVFSSSMRINFLINGKIDVLSLITLSTINIPQAVFHVD